MAVRIRLKKMGRRHRPFFRICAMDSRMPRDGRVIEELGVYDPMIRETDARVTLNGERVNYWLGVGAQPTPKVGVLIKKYGAEGTHLEAQKQAIERMGVKKPLPPAIPVPKPEPPAAEAPAEEAPAEEAAAESTEEAQTEAPAEEAKAEEAKTEEKSEEKSEEKTEEGGE